ncbi:MAG: biopolymer transporter ExbD [Phycisphaerae bacterium]|nr:biopolymer transporter ExbD [Phycisphaerae bacterium]
MTPDSRNKQGEVKSNEAGAHPHPRAKSRLHGLRSHRRTTPLAFSFAPLIDVTFLLLIFFVVTTTFERAEGLLSSRVPEDTGPAAVELPLTPIIVRVRQVGPDPENVSLLLEKFDRRPANFNQLVEELEAIQTLPGFDRETPVVIMADNAVRWDHVVNAWNAALRAGCKRVAFGDSESR